MKHNIKSLVAAGVRFMHFRAITEVDGRTIVEPHGGMTVAYRDITPEGADAKQIQWSMAMCASEKDAGGRARYAKYDNYNRKVGALIAGGRLLNGQASADSYEIFKHFVDNIADANGYQRKSRARRNKTAA